MSFLKLKIEELSSLTASKAEIKSLKQEIINTIPNFQIIANEIFKDANIFVYKQKDSKNPLFWTFNGCPLFYNHTLKSNKEEQNNQKEEKKGKKNKKDFVKPTICPNLILVLEYPDLLPSIYCDEIAVEKVIGGASFMARGIKGIERPFQKGDVVALRLLGEEDAFAVGVASISSQQLEDKTKNLSGMAVDVSHVLKDQLWEMMISNRKEDKE